MKINWITIRTDKFEESKKFYGEYLGMAAENEFSPSESVVIAFFTADAAVQIELLYDKSRPAASQSGGGVSIGISFADYDRLLKEAETRGILTSGPVILGGSVECFFVTDPNGVGIQIIKENRPEH